MPINTGEIKAFVDKKRDEGLQAFGAIKEDKKAAFNVWLSGQQALLEQKAKEKMEQEAQSRFDNMKEKRFGSGHGFTTRFSKS